MKLLKGKRLESDASSCYTAQLAEIESGDLKTGQHSRRPLEKESWNVAQFVE